jgi:hypothetical protein
LLRNICAQIAAQGGRFAFLDPHGENAEAIVSLIPTDRAAELAYIDLTNIDQFVGLNFLDGVPPDKRSDDYRAAIVSKVQDPLVRSYWAEAFGTWDDRFRDQVTAPISNKLDACLSHPAIRHIISQPKSSIDLRRIMDQNRILIVNLSKGSVGEHACRFFGALLVSAITSAAFSRADIHEDRRAPFDLVLDEFQSVITTDITTILSEARKYRLQLTLASQFLSQIPDDILAAVFGNAGTYISFRLGSGDAAEVARQLDFNEQAFLDLRNFAAFVRPLIDGGPGNPEYIEMFPPPVPLHDRAAQLIRNSNVRFARKRHEVEAHVRQMFGP